MTDPIRKLIVNFHGADAAEQQHELDALVEHLHEQRRTIRNYRIGVAVAIVLMLWAVVARAQTVVNLPSGVLGSYEFTAGNTYVGNNTTFKGTAPIRVSGGNVTIRGIKFDGTGIRRDGNLSGLMVDSCEFRNMHVAVECNGGSGVTVRSSLFDNCDFTSWISDNSDLLWEQNEIRNSRYGIKVFGNSSANKNWTARRNYIHDCPNDFMAFEWQGACSNWSIVENLVEKIAYGPNFNDNDHSLLVSAPMALSVGPGLLRGNVIIGKQPRDGGYPGAWINGHPAIVEAGGSNTVIENNIFNGGGVGVTVTDKDGPASVTIRNNTIVNVYTIWNQDKPATQTVTTSNNGAISQTFTADSLRPLVGRLAPIVPETHPTTSPFTRTEAEYQTAVQQRDAAIAARDAALQRLDNVRKAGGW